ncbi:hypothetical protein [Mycolicibacterium celeriflavum]|uniref:hypothetical protein n=1 Tax=Mycolicibacterium celeriflavum TaxID=1249101 RepID=UPI0010569428|nr:hypothetical protein [Mycolicibacterium celeriflavum]MCV7237299.1 hypothetical protein [Mycolicibacterium celeriflavum]
MGSWKKVTSRPDLRLWAARAVAMRAKVLGFVERYPWAVGVVAVPMTVLGLAGVAIYPYVFVPLLVLASLALIVVEACATQQEEAEHQAHVRSHEPRSAAANMLAEPSLPPLGPEARMRAEAVEARSRATELWAQAKAAEARALAAEARAGEVKLRREAEEEAETIQFPRVEYP